MQLDQDDASARASALAQSLDTVLPHTARGRQLDADPRFRELVALLASAFDAPQRGALLSADSDALRCAAVAAMDQAGDRGHREAALRLDGIGYYALDFAIDYLAGCTDPEVFGRFLLRLPAYAGDVPDLRYKVFHYVQQMLAACVVPRLSDADARLDWDLEERRDALADYDFPVVQAFVEGLRPVEQERRARDARAAVATTPLIRQRQDALHALLTAPARPSVLVVGDAGAGRRTLIRAVLDDLVRDGWTVVDASPRELLATLQHVEPVGERVAAMGRAASGERTLWHVTHWFELLEDAASHSATTVLEHLWPQVEAGTLQLVAASSPNNLRRATEDLRQFDEVFRTLHIERMDMREALALGQDWAQGESGRVGTPVIDEATLADAFLRAERSLPRRIEPGRTLATLREALREASADPAGFLPIPREAIMRVLARRSGDAFDDR